MSGFLANGNLPQLSRQSRLSANDKDDSEMIPGAVPKSQGIFLAAEENPGKPQLGNRVMKAVRPAIASNGVSYLHLRSVESPSTSVREKVGEKGSASVGTYITLDIFFPTGPYNK